MNFSRCNDGTYIDTEYVCNGKPDCVKSFFIDELKEKLFYLASRFIDSFIMLPQTYSDYFNSKSSLTHERF